MNRKGFNDVFQARAFEINAMHTAMENARFGDML